MGQNLIRPKIDGSNCIVVVPAFNEEKSLGSVLAGLVESGLQCVVIDDGSTDGTSRIARQFPVDLLRLPVNFGVGGALRLGFKFAIANNFEAAIQFDADGQHEHHEIESLFREANASGADLVIGSRFRSTTIGQEISFSRRVAMSALASMATRYTNTRITDSTSGFRLVRRPLLEEFASHLPTHYLGDTFEALVLTGRAKYQVTEVATRMSKRAFGSSSASRFAAVSLIARAVLAVLFRLSQPFESSSNRS